MVNTCICFCSFVSISLCTVWLILGKLTLMRFVNSYTKKDVNYFTLAQVSGFA